MSGGLANATEPFTRSSGSSRKTASKALSACAEIKDAVEKLWLNAVWGRDSIAAVLRIRGFAMMGRLNEPEQFFYAFRLESHDSARSSTAWDRCDS